MSISDLPCSAPPTISPANGLFITEGETNTLSCTAPHQDYEIENVYYVTSSDESDVHIDAISIIGKTRFVNSTANSTYLLNLLWTKDLVLRRKLDSIYCVVVYRDGSMICKSSSINITFIGMYYVATISATKY